jgi:hypothetical protein
MMRRVSRSLTNSSQRQSDAYQSAGTIAADAMLPAHFSADRQPNYFYGLMKEMPSPRFARNDTRRSVSPIGQVMFYLVFCFKRKRSLDDEGSSRLERGVTFFRGERYELWLVPP